jgi:hypothetical protein
MATTMVKLWFSEPQIVEEEMRLIQVLARSTPNEAAIKASETNLEIDVHFIEGTISAAVEIVDALIEGFSEKKLHWIQWLYVQAQGDEDKASEIDDCSFYEGSKMTYETFLDGVYNNNFIIVSPNEARFALELMNGSVL